jgi:outer membrane protein OmpA-like peptidoglycan-associated protein
MKNDLYTTVFLLLFAFLSPTLMMAQNAKYRGDAFLFEGDSQNLLPSSVPNLKSLYKFMRRNPSVRIELAGHTNGRHRESSLELALARAEVVRAYLMNKGIKYNRVEVKTYGGKHPLYKKPNNSQEEALNRRVEVKILQY